MFVSLWSLCGTFNLRHRHFLRVLPPSKSIIASCSLEIDHHTLFYTYASNLI
ncbi:hypothetical protein Hanom_Chr10g00933871 [Helianthus anomalus]